MTNNEAASVAQLTGDALAQELADIMRVVLGRRLAENEWQIVRRECATLCAVLALPAPPAAPVQGDALRAALQRLEVACDRRSRLLTADAYNAASALPGMTDALLELDAARTEARTLLAAPAAPATGEAGAEPVGHAGSMPGADGFTMACFKASDVPIGTALYATPPAAKSEAASQPGEMGAGVRRTHSERDGTVRASLRASARQDEPICPACNGSGQIATGCDEWSSTICKGCEGTGMTFVTPSAQQDEREAFEAAILRLFPASYGARGFELRGDGLYRNGFIREAWEVWKARAQQVQADAGAVAWLVSVPNEPELGHWFAEEPAGDGYSSQPLYTRPAAESDKRKNGNE